MRFKSISSKIKLCWKKNFLVRNYLIYDLQAGTEVRQNWGQRTSDPFYCCEWLKLWVARDDFRKVKGTTQHCFKRNSWFILVPLLFPNVNQPVRDPHRPPAAAPAWGSFTPFSEIPSHNGVSRRALQNAFVSNICVVGRNERAVAGAFAPWRDPPAGPLTPVAVPRCDHCWPWGALCKINGYTRSLVSIKRCHTSHWGISSFPFLFQKLGSSLVWGD